VNDLIEISQGRSLTLTQDITAETALGLWLAGFPSDNTKRAYKYELKAFASFVKAGDLADAIRWFLALDDGQARAVVAAWRQNKLKEGLSPSSINRSLFALNSFVTAARGFGATELRLEIKGEATQAYRDTRGPGVANVRKMIKAAGEHKNPNKAARDVAILLLGFGLGLRRGEIASLNVGHVDLNGTLSIMGKGRSERETLTLPAGVVRDALAAWLALRGDDAADAPLFISLSTPPTHTRLSGSAIHKIVRKLGEEIGIIARPHGLRHSAITAALDVFGGDFRKVGKFSRHLDIKTILRYDDNRADHGGQVAAALSAIVAD
jgi:integrase/recombinase XerC